MCAPAAAGRVLLLVAALAGSPAVAQDAVYKPTDPSFGGNPFNSGHLLGVANAQNKYRDPTAANSNDPGQIFARQLQSRLLSAMSSQLVDAIFGDNPQQHGTISFGGQTIVFDRGLEDVTLTITDSATGQSTTIIVPTTVAIN